MGYVGLKPNHFSGSIDVQGNPIVLDADNDTKIKANNE